jgi:DNA-binding transcriptional LysR family regulator
LRQLQVFAAIASHGTASEAAQRLAMSQSAVSTALAQLENQFDRQLFDRRGKRLRLNENGELLLPKARELLERAEEIEALLTSGQALGHVRVGATLTIGNYLGTLLVSEFTRRHPQARVSLEVSNTTHIAQRVAAFDLDLGLIEGEWDDPALEVTDWIADELAVFCAPEHALARARRSDPHALARAQSTHPPALARAHPSDPHALARAKQISIERALKEEWIVRERGSGTRQTLDRALGSWRSKLRIRMELEHTEGIKRAVEAGLGLGCVSRLALTDAFRRGSLVELKLRGLDLSRKFHFLLHREKYRTPGMDAFLALCRETAAHTKRSDEMLGPTGALRQLGQLRHVSKKNA